MERRRASFPLVSRGDGEVRLAVALGHLEGSVKNPRLFIPIYAMAYLPAEAIPLCSNFNVSMAFDPNSGWVADGADLTDQVAESFTTLVQASLTRIQVAMGFYAGRVNPVLYLESDAPGQPSSGHAPVARPNAPIQKHMSLSANIFRLLNFSGLSRLEFAPCASRRRKAKFPQVHVGN